MVWTKWIFILKCLFLTKGKEIVNFFLTQWKTVYRLVGTCIIPNDVNWGWNLCLLHMLVLRPFPSSCVVWGVPGNGFLPLSLCQSECDSTKSYIEKLTHIKTFCWHIFHLGKFLSPGHCSADRAVAWKGQLEKLSGVAGTVQPNTARERDISSKYQRVCSSTFGLGDESPCQSSKTGQAHPWLPGPHCYSVPPRLLGQVARTAHWRLILAQRNGEVTAEDDEIGKAAPLSVHLCS